MRVLAAARSAAATTRLSLLHLRVERGTFALAFAVVAVTCFLFAAMPRAFAGFANRAFQREAAAAGPIARGIDVTVAARIRAGGNDPLRRVAARGERELTALPAPLPQLVGRRETVVDAPRLAISKPIPGLNRYLELRTLTGVRDHVRIVRGRLPQRSKTTVAVTTTLGRRVRVPVLEIALSQQTAEALHLTVGDRFSSLPDAHEIGGGLLPPDLLVQSVPGSRLRPVVTRVVGLLRVRDPKAPYWFGGSRLPEPEVKQTNTATYVFGYALAARGAYGDLLRATAPVPLRYEWRYFTVPDRFDAEAAGAIRAAAVQLDADRQLAGPLAKQAQTALADLVDSYFTDRRQAETLLAIAVIGLLACSTTVIGLLAALGTRRRRLAVELLRSRGGSPTQIVGGRIVEGAAVAVPAAVAGLAIALAVTHAGGVGVSSWLTTAIAAATVASFAAGAVALARRRIETSPRDEVVLPKLSPRRLVLEGLAVTAAAVGVVLLRRRGLEPEGSGSAGLDPYLAAVPVLLGLGAALAVLRLYPLPLRLLLRAGGRSRGIVSHLALGRAARAPAVGALPLVVLILALAIACFAAILLRSIGDGQQREAWERVGADLRVDTGDAPLPPGLAERLGAARSARAFASGTDLGGGAGPQLLAVEPDAYRGVLAGGPVAAAGDLLDGLGGGHGLRAIAAGSWAYGDRVSVEVAGRRLTIDVVAHRRRFPSAPVDEATAVVSLPALQRALGDRLAAPNRLYADGATAHPEIAGADALSRAQTLAQLRGAPFVEGTTLGFRIAIGLAALYAALAVVLSVFLTARSRSRDLAYLATLGLSRRQALGLAAGELAPLALVSAAAGAGLGIGVALLVEPGIDLSFFTGAASSPLVLPGGLLAVLACGLVVLVGLAALTAAVVAGRTDPTRALRIGESG